MIRTFLNFTEIRYRRVKKVFELNFKFQMGTMASIHGSTNPSIAGSRPTTPYTTVSTIH